MVWHHSLPLMNSFNKTEAAVFSCRLCFLGAFPFISLNIQNCRTYVRLTGDNSNIRIYFHVKESPLTYLVDSRQSKGSAFHIIFPVCTFNLMVYFHNLNYVTGFIRFLFLGIFNCSYLYIHI